MKRKKLMALCLAAAMSASMLAGCGSDGKEASGDSKEQSSAEESGEEAQDSAEESSGEEAEASTAKHPTTGRPGERQPQTCLLSRTSSSRIPCPRIPPWPRTAGMTTMT